MAAEVDVYGIDETLKKFGLHRCDDFAVFSGQGDKWRLKFAGSGKELFEENVKSIDPNNDATYQVRFYKKDFDEENISSQSPYNASFNFKVRSKMLSAPAGGNTNPALSYGDQRYIARLEDENRELKDQLHDLQADLADANDMISDHGDKNKKSLGAMGQIGEALNEYPGLADLLKPLIHSFAGLFTKMPAAPASAINGVHAATEPSEDVIKDQFNNSLLKLHAYYSSKYGDQGDRQYADDMKKLADLTDKPIFFEAAIAQLRTT